MHGYYNKKGREICGSLRADGINICQSVWVMINGRCKKHGGKSLSGTNHPVYAGKGKSKYVPTRILPAYIEYNEQQDIVDLRHEISVISARMEEILATVYDGEARSLWQAMHSLATKPLRTGESAGNRLRAIKEICESAKENREAWQEYVFLVGQLRRLKETQRKRERDAQQLITAERAILLIDAAGTAFTDAVYQNCENEELAERILRDAKAKTAKLLISGGMASASSRPAGMGIKE